MAESSLHPEAEVLSAQSPSPDRFRLFEQVIENCTMDEAIRWVMLPRFGARMRVGFFMNVHSYCQQWRSARMKADLGEADRLFADGVGLRLGAKRVGVEIKANVNGTDLAPQLFDAMARLGKSVYLLGGAPGVADAAAVNVLHAHPGIRIAGHQHGYFDPAATAEVIEQINAARPDILLVAFGSPLQERWLVRHREALNVPTGLAVGGLFDFLAHRIPRAPAWMRRLELEWVYRLIQEPAKKWRRYVLGNAEYLLRLIFERR